MAQKEEGLTLSQLRARIRHAEKARGAADSEMHELQVQLARRTCPFEEGSRFRNRGRVWEVETILPPAGFSGKNWSLVARRVRNDGKLGAARGRFYESQASELEVIDE
jgi:hypothetical protein